MTTKVYTCTLDAEGWQLYGGADSAAKALSEAMTEKVRAAKAALRNEPRLSEHKLAEGIRDEMHKLMDQYADDGACDTEPQCALVAELEEAFGLDQYALDR